MGKQQLKFRKLVKWLQKVTKGENKTQYRTGGKENKPSYLFLYLFPIKL